MTEALRHTRWLVAVLLVLVAVDVWAHLRADAQGEPLPRLAPFDTEEPVRLRITHGEEVVELARLEGAWQVTAPYTHRADGEHIDAILGLLARGVDMDARVDDGEHDRYGLDGGDPILVEVEATSAPLARFYVGANVEGGSTFVRFPDAEPVYRARIGGRSRYDRPPGAWRDPRVFELEADEVVRLAMNGLSFVREPVLGPDGRPAAGTWELGGDPSFDLDINLLDASVSAMATLRAEDILSPDFPGGLDAPDVRVELGLDSGETRQLELAVVRGQAYGRRHPGEPVYRLPLPLAQVLSAPRSGWRNRTLLTLDTTAMAGLILAHPDGTAVLERDPRSSVWRMTRPNNVDVDSRQIERVATFIGRLRVEDFVDGGGTFAGSSTVTVVAIDGVRHVVEVGDLVPNRPQGREARYVRLADAPGRVGTLSARAWSAVRQAFAR